MMLAVSLAGIVCGSAIILRGHRNEIKETALIYFIGFVVIMQIASILNNSYGRYNLSKTCLTAGFFNHATAEGGCQLQADAFGTKMT